MQNFPRSANVSMRLLLEYDLVDKVKHNLIELLINISYFPVLYISAVYGL